MEEVLFVPMLVAVGQGVHVGVVDEGVVAISPGEGLVGEVGQPNN